MIMRKVRKTEKGELNRLIDKLMHPYLKEHPALIIVDSLLHAMVEQDPDMTLRLACIHACNCAIVGKCKVCLRKKGIVLFWRLQFMFVYSVFLARVLLAGVSAHGLGLESVFRQTPRRGCP